MQRYPRLAVKVALSLIGLAALLLPIILTITGFQPLGFLLKNNSNSKPTVTQTTLVPVSSSSGTPLLSKTDFEMVKNKQTSLLVDIRANAGNSSGVLIISANELARVVNDSDQGKLKDLFKNSNLVLLTNDLISAQKIAISLKEKGFTVSIYLSDGKN